MSERCIDGAMRVQWSNEQSVRARVDAIQALIRDEFGEHSRVWLEALDEAALSERLEALRATLPPVEQRPAKYWPS